MPVFSINQRLRIALGGFVSFTGFIILACVILSLTNTANLASVFQGTILAFVITIVGVLDIDSPVLSRFDEEDQEGLEKIVKILEDSCHWE